MIIHGLLKSSFQTLHIDASRKDTALVCELQGDDGLEATL